MRKYSATQQMALLTIVIASILSAVFTQPLYFTTMLVPVFGAIANREYQRRKKELANREE